MRFTAALPWRGGGGGVKCRVGVARGPLASVLGLSLLGCEAVLWDPVTPLVLPGLTLLRQYGVRDPLVRVRGGRRGLFWADCGAGVAVEWVRRGLSAVEAFPDWLSRLLGGPGEASCRVYYLPHVRVVGPASLLHLVDGVGGGSGFTVSVRGCSSRIVFTGVGVFAEPLVFTSSGGAVFAYPYSGGAVLVGVDGAVDELLSIVSGEPQTDIRVGYGSCDEPCRVEVSEEAVKCVNCPSVIASAALSGDRRVFDPVIAGPWWLLG